MHYLITIFAYVNLLFLAKISCISAQMNMTIYQTLPPLYNFNNYDQCLSQKDSSYCIVFAQIESNNYSDIWFNIEKISHDLWHHFRHENLFFGVCVEQCTQLYDNLSSIELQNYTRNKTLANEITEYYQQIHKRKGDRENRLLYHHILDVCLNYKFQQKFNLTLATSIEYCEASQRTHELDFLDIIFCIILVTIVLLNIISSLYDYRLKIKCQNYENNDFYKNKLTGYNCLLTSFSICRNYYRTIGLSSKSANLNDSNLNFTYAFRIFALFIVILGHCIMLLMSIQIQNPEFIEQYYYKAESILFQNGTAIIQIFFVLAGFLLKFKFDESKAITTESGYKTAIFIYIQGFLNRYLRIFPSLLAVILFNATLLMRLEDGPFWRHVAESEYTFCRQYWWKNIFMINNFMLKNSCVQHTWFLAADMQLYEIFLFTVILTSKFKIWKKPLYTLYGLIAFLVPGSLTYFYKLDAIPFLKPESYRYLFFKDVETFYLTYPQFYCNMGGYLIGFICAEIYLKNIRSQKQNYSKYRGVMKFELTLLALILLTALGLLFSGNLVIGGYIEKPSIWLSLYASLYRNMWSILGGFILLCMLKKMGWIAYEIACLPIFRIMGRISFQSYLWHVTVLKILAGFYRKPVYLNELYVICQILLAFIITNVVAFFMALFMEYPIAEIVHFILKPKISQNKKFDNDNEMKPHLAQIHT